MQSRSKQPVQIGDWEDQRSQHPAGPGTPRAPSRGGREGLEGRPLRRGRASETPATLQTRPLTSAAPPHQPFVSKAPSARLPLPHFHSRSTSVSSCCPALQPLARLPAHAMDAKVVAVLALVLAALCISDGKCNPRPGPRRAGSSAPCLPQVLGSSARVRVGEKELVRRPAPQANLRQPLYRAHSLRVPFPVSHASHRGFVLCQARS